MIQGRSSGHLSAKKRHKVWISHTQRPAEVPKLRSISSLCPWCLGAQARAGIFGETETKLDCEKGEESGDYFIRNVVRRHFDLAEKERRGRDYDEKKHSVLAS